MLVIYSYVTVLYLHFKLIYSFICYSEEWKTHFVPRNLKAYATNPRLMFPAHYPGDDNYISDTEHNI